MFLRSLILACFASLAACGTGIEVTSDSISDSKLLQIEVAADEHWYPDQTLTPGHLCSEEDIDFDEYRYAERIPHCRRNVSKAKKITVSAPYGVTPEELPGYQVDHLIPLSIGGSNASYNLWPVPYSQARAKAQFEFETYEFLKSGSISQSVAIQRILDWVMDNLM